MTRKKKKNLCSLTQFQVTGKVFDFIINVIFAHLLLLTARPLPEAWW